MIRAGLALLILFVPLTARAEDGMRCMQAAIYHEARGEPVAGQIAVAQVIMNRVRTPGWPKSICEVVYQAGQFTDIDRDRIVTDAEAWKFAWAIAVFTTQGLLEDPTHGAIYFYNPRKVKCPRKWAQYVVLAVIENHVFLRES